MATLASKFNISSDGCYLSLIPFEHRDITICLELVRRYVYNIIYVPIDILSKELCMIAFNGSYYDLIKYIPDDFKTKEICEMAVMVNARNIKFVPDDFKTKEMCKEAFNRNPSVVLDIPQEYISASMYMRALKKDGSIIKYIPEWHKTYELCLAAVSSDILYYRVMECIPKEHKTYKLCNKWLEHKDNNHDCLNLEDIPENIKTEEFYRKAVKVSVEYLHAIPEELHISDLKIEESNDFICLFELIPDRFKTPELIKKFKELNKDSSEYWIRVLKESDYSSYSFKTIPDKFKTKEMCELFVFRNKVNE